MVYQFTLRIRNIIIASLKKIENAFSFCAVSAVGIESVKSGTSDYRNIVSRETVCCKKFAHFHFNEFEKFFVVNLVAFVHEYDKIRNTDLAGKKDVFFCLRHRTVGCGNNDDCSVHLSGACDHVFDVVGVTRAVNVSIVTFFSFVFNVRSSDGDTAFFFLPELCRYCCSQ